MLRQPSRYHARAAGSKTKYLVFDSQEEQGVFLFCKVSRQDEGPTQTLVQYKAQVLSLSSKVAVT